jgi:hypothetical protein
LTAISLRRALIESLILADNLLFILTSYFHLLKFNAIGKGIAANTSLGINTVGSGKTMRNFDQWTEELSKQIVDQSDEEERKALGKANEIFVDDDFEEEE